MQLLLGDPSEGGRKEGKSKEEFGMVYLFYFGRLF